MNNIFKLVLFFITLFVTIVMIVSTSAYLYLLILCNYNNCMYIKIQILLISTIISFVSFVLIISYIIKLCILDMVHEENDDG